MTSILADQAALAQHPSWCAGHLPSDDERATHISVDQVLQVAAGGESAQLYVSLEQVDGQPAAIRIQNAGDAPMTPAQALELAQVLTVSAFAAVSGGAR